MAAVEIHTAGGNVARFNLIQSLTSFGSSGSSDVQLPAAGGHCEFIVEQRPDGIWLRDVGSRPPILMSGAGVGERRIFDGDQWENGCATFRLVLRARIAAEPARPPADAPVKRASRATPPATNLEREPRDDGQNRGSTKRVLIWLCVAATAAGAGSAYFWNSRSAPTKTGQGQLDAQRIDNLLANAPARIDSLVDELRVSEAESLIETLREQGAPRQQCSQLTGVLTDAARDRYDILLDEAADNLARNDLRSAEAALDRANRLSAYVSDRSRHIRLTGELSDQKTRLSVDAAVAAIERSKPNVASLEPPAVSERNAVAAEVSRANDGAGRRVGAAVRFVVSPPSAIIRMDAAGTAESGQTLSGLQDGSIRFVAEARGYMTLSASAPVSSGRLTVVSVTLCPQPPDFLWVLNLLSGTPAQALAARYYESEYATDRWKAEFRQLAARRGRAVRRDIARLEMDNGDVMVAVIERRNSSQLEVRLLDGTTRRIPRLKIKDERLATPQEAQQAGLEPACTAFLKATDRVEAAFANLAAFVQDCPASADVVLEKCGTRIGNVLGKLELACATCHGTRDVPCSGCRGTGKRVELRTCSACEGGKKTCFRCKGSGLVNCSKCGGRGTLDESVMVVGKGYPHNETILVPCNACEMSGTMTCTACGGRKGISCQICRGSGKVEKHGNCSLCGGTSRVACPDCNGDGSRAAMNSAKREAIERAMARYDDCHISVSISYGD